VIDPPWPMKKIERGVRPNQGEYLDYPTMKLAEIYNLDVESLAAEDGCHLYLWTTHKFLPEALKITAKWGFRYNCLLTWEKIHRHDSLPLPL
jgi:N6-adenosine-specific RNA methylase IME4